MKPTPRAIDVYIRPSPDGGVDEAVVDNEVICRSAAPAVAAARALMRRGNAPDTEVRLHWASDRGRDSRQQEYRGTLDSLHKLGAKGGW
jgi:hypothetical protein